MKSAEQRIKEVLDNMLSTNKEIMTTLTSVKGEKYANKIQAAVAMIHMQRNLFKIACDKTPKELLAAVVDASAVASERMVFAMADCDDKIYDEMFVTIRKMVERRVAEEDQATAIFEKALKDGELGPDSI